MLWAEKINTEKLKGKEIFGKDFVRKKYEVFSCHEYI